jgi:hypothetical protein
VSRLFVGVVVVVSCLCAGSTCQPRLRRRPPGPPAPLIFTMPDRPVCDGSYDDAAEVAVVDDAGLTEISGLATSLQNPDLAWAIADAGNAAAVYGVSLSTGKTRLTLALPVDNVDDEDIAVGPCPDLSGPCVFVGDTGDNDGDRDHVVVYAFPEPVLDEGSPGTADVEAVFVLPLAFPGGAAVDVEAFAVLPDASAQVLIEKAVADEARVFAARAPWTLALDDDTPPQLLEQTGVVSLVDVGDGPDDRVVSGAAAHWSGTRLLLRARGGLVEFTGDGPAALLDPSTTTLRAVLPSPAGEGGRGEAVSYDEAGTGVFSVAEADVDAVPVLHRSACR